MATRYRTEIEHVEYLDGKAHARISGRHDHALIVGQIGFTIDRCAGDRGTSSFSTDAYLKKRGPRRTKLIPDVSFISEEQYRAHPRSAWDEPPFSPEIAAEVVSPGESEAYLQAKFDRYLATGSILVLEVSPEKRTIIAHAATGVRLFTESELFEHPAVPWLRFELRTIFRVLERFKRG